MNRLGGIYKLGSRRLRNALYFPALTGMIHNPILIDMSQLLIDRGRTGQSAIATLMRKLLQSDLFSIKNGFLKVA